MFDKSKQLALVAIILTNMTTYFIVDYIVRNDEAEVVSKTFKKEISKYIILMDNNEFRTVQTLMIGFIYPEIVDAGMKKSSKGKSYLCDAWKQGLANVISKNFNLNEEMSLKSVEKKNDLALSFEKGKSRLNELCDQYESE